MVRLPVYGIILCGSLVSALARADHFAVDLRVKGPEKGATATADVGALGVKPKSRGTFAVKAGERLTAKWKLTNNDAKRKARNVLVHFFVVKEGEAGQQVIPKLDKDVVIETALTMDFDPKDKNEGELTFTVDRPGVYLLRLETIGTAAGADGHEHFAALDLVVR